MLNRFQSATLNVGRSSLCPFSCPTTSARFSTEEKKNEDEEISFESLKPSTAFTKRLKNDVKTNYLQTLKEFEIFVYMGHYVPKKMSDEDWNQSIFFSSVKEKVGFWEYLAVKQRRQDGRGRRKEQGTEAFRLFLNEQEEKIKNGGMGYGPEMYQLVNNPMRNKKKVQNIEGSRVYSSMMADMPTVALDLQYLPTMPHRNQSELGNQIQYAISENFASKRPFLLKMVNQPKEEFVNTWIEKSIGYYGGSYTGQTLLPDFHSNGIKETCSKNKNIVYISNYARDVLDGPITADVFGLCVSMDHKRESLGAARRAGIRAFRLPIHRYVKWKSGPQFLPIPNIINVLRQVYENGGDWKTALLNNISKRHLVDANEDETKKVLMLRKRARDDEKRELIETIMAATQR